jgi:hypothetical protein
MYTLSILYAGGNMYTTLRVYKDTVQNFKVLAAQEKTTMIDLLDQMVKMYAAAKKVKLPNQITGVDCARKRNSTL